MDARRRAWVFAALVAACVLGGGAYVAAAALRAGDPAGDRAGVEVALPPAGEPVLVFLDVDRVRGQRSFGHLAWAPLDRPAERHVTGIGCERVDFDGDAGLCLARRGGYPFYGARVVDSELRVVGEVPTDGIPSRARAAPSGPLGAVTTFVTGHSYAAPGSFSTETSVLDLRRGVRVANVEDFEFRSRGERLDPADLNIWGVTWADDGDRFYATAATGSRTYLVEGRASEQRARVLRENVECPSLSPDGTRIGYKKLVDRPGVWRFHVLDLESGRDVPLAETESVDDQLEWLDDDRLAYGKDGAVWAVRADGSGRPERLLARAASPSVARF